MLSAAAIVVIALIISSIEILLLIKNKWIKELWVFTLLMILATGLASAEAMRVNLPNPLDGLAILFKPMSDWIMSLLK